MAVRHWFLGGMKPSGHQVAGKKSERGFCRDRLLPYTLGQIKVRGYRLDIGIIYGGVVRNLSVKEVADVLGISARAVLKRLNNDQLRGTRRSNKFGVEEWSVYPNKEIRAALEAAGKIDIFEAEYVTATETESVPVDADETDSDEVSDERSRGWYIEEREKVRIIAEEMVRPLSLRIEQQAVALNEKDRIIEEKDRQLKLLPDFEKQAEKERKAAELKALEAEALKKQIAALEIEKQEADAAKERAAELEKALEQLKAEKAEKEQAVEQKLAAVQQQLEKLQQPWYKKIFG